MNTCPLCGGVNQRGGHKPNCANDTAAQPCGKAEVVTFKRDEWTLLYGGDVHPATWNSKGAAQAHGDACERAGRMLP